PCVAVPRLPAALLQAARAHAALHHAAPLCLADTTELYEGDTRLASPRVVETRVSLESAPSSRSYEEALAHATGPRLPNGMQLFWEQGLPDVLLVVPVRSEGAEFSMRPESTRLRWNVLVVSGF